MSKKVTLVTGDPQRPNVSQRRNIEQFAKILHKTAFKDTEVLIDLPTISEEEWIRTQQEDGPSFITEAMLETVKSVIGFELPKAVVKFLEKRNVPYVDVCIHPARFLPDLVMGIRTNMQNVKEFLSKNQCTFREMEVYRDVYIDYIRETAARFPTVFPEIDFKGMQEKTLVIGQSPRDRSVLYEGKFHTVEEYVQDWSDKLYKPHPDDAYRIIPAQNWTNANIYRLLMEGKFEKVVGISSSALFEAELFGHRVETFGPRYWRNLIPIKAKDFFLMPDAPPNTFRRVFGVFWGYEKRD